MTPPYPPPTHRVRLHFKVLYQPPTMTPDAMVASMRDVYARYCIDVVVAPDREDLSRLDTFKDLYVASCGLHSATSHQAALFVHRDKVPANEICIYFIRCTHDSFAGCSSLASAAGPAAVVTKDATPWTLGHECGHLLGLVDVSPSIQVMYTPTAAIASNPPVLEPDEVETIKNSPFVAAIGPPPPLPCPPQPSPPTLAFRRSGDSAMHRTDCDSDGLAETIHRELDHDDGIDYDGLARRFGPPAAEALSTVVCASRPRIAAGAVCLAARLEGAVGFPIVAQASVNADPEVRVAAAASARRLPVAPASPIVARLLDDRDVGVRGYAVRTAVLIAAPELLRRVTAIAERDPSPALRELAARLLEQPCDSFS